MAIVGALLIPWFVSLPQRLRTAILVAGGLFLTGTVVLELIGGYLADSGMRMSTEWTVVASIEESLELIGVAVLFSGLLAYVASESSGYVSTSSESGQTPAKEDVLKRPRDCTTPVADEQGGGSDLVA